MLRTRNAWACGREWRWWASGCWHWLCVAVPAGVSHGRERVVLQHVAGSRPAAVRLRRSLHPLEPVQLAGQQRCARGGAVLGDPGRGAHRRRAPEACCSTCSGVVSATVSRAPRGSWRGSRPTGSSSSPPPPPARSMSIRSAHPDLVLITYVAISLLSACGCCRGWSRRSHRSPIARCSPHARPADHRIHRRRPLHRAAASHRRVQGRCWRHQSPMRRG